MIIAGFDPGSISFGVGVVSKEGSSIHYLFSSEIKLREKSLLEKMRIIWHDLLEMVDKYPIQQIAFEEGFLGKNVRSMNTLDKIRGLIMAVAIHRQIPCFGYSPREIKTSLTGSGSAGKDQVQRTMRILLHTANKLHPDEADALATAYCHCLRIR